MYRRGVLLMTMALMGGRIASAWPGEVLREDFVPGQVWSVKAAPTSMRVVIVSVEPWNGRTAVHVSISGIPVQQGTDSSAGFANVGHMPFDEEALAGSVDQLLGTNAAPLPGYASGYQQWKSAKGGIFTIGVLQGIAAIFSAGNK